MNLQEAMKFIHCTDWKGSRLGLDRMRELMGYLGNPQDRLKYIHVAGTNGKGSTAAMLASILTEAGYQTGLYTSPHLWKINERMSVCGREIDDEDLIAAAQTVKSAADRMPDQPTEFEIITAMAFCYFERQECDLVVLEVGLGGRLDATNVIPAPEVAVITNIGLEHTEILGDTLEKIAGEKAGILKAGCSAVVYRSTEEVEAVYDTICDRMSIPLRKAAFDAIYCYEQSLDGQTFDYGIRRELKLPLLGGHQRNNAAVVLETIDALRARGWNISEGAVYSGLAKTVWPARFEVLSRDPLFIADGAHNPQCMEMLEQNLASHLSGTSLVFLTGVLADKDYEQMLRFLFPFAKSFVCLTPDSPRALRAEDLAEYLRRHGQNAEVCVDVAEGILSALNAAEGTPVVACGSLYMMGEIREQFPVVFEQWLCNSKPTDCETIWHDEK